MNAEELLIRNEIKIKPFRLGGSGTYIEGDEGFPRFLNEGYNTTRHGWVKKFVAGATIVDGWRRAFSMSVTGCACSTDSFYTIYVPVEDCERALDLLKKAFPFTVDKDYGVEYSKSAHSGSCA